MSNILAVGAHPDDLEVGCFGTLIKHKRMGDRIHVAMTTKGGYSNRKWKTIEDELHASMTILNPDSYIVLNNKIDDIWDQARDSGINEGVFLDILHEKFPKLLNY